MDAWDHRSWKYSLTKYTSELVFSFTELVLYSFLQVDFELIEFIFLSDPFADAIKGSDDDVQDGLVHIRIQQRNGRKTLTTVQGLSSEYDLKKIVRACKKVRITCLVICLLQGLVS
jgi:hypothetical protein